MKKNEYERKGLLIKKEEIETEMHNRTIPENSDDRSRSSFGFNPYIDSLINFLQKAARTWFAPMLPLSMIGVSLMVSRYCLMSRFFHGLEELTKNTIIGSSLILILLFQYYREHRILDSNRKIVNFCIRYVPLYVVIYYGLDGIVDLITNNRSVDLLKRENNDTPSPSPSLALDDWYMCQFFRSLLFYLIVILSYFAGSGSGSDFPVMGYPAEVEVEAEAERPIPFSIAEIQLPNIADLPLPPLLDNSIESADEARMPQEPLALVDEARMPQEPLVDEARMPQEPLALVDAESGDARVSQHPFSSGSRETRISPYMDPESSGSRENWISPCVDPESSPSDDSRISQHTVVDLPSELPDTWGSLTVVVNYPPESHLDNTRILVSVDVVSNEESELPSDDTGTSQDSHVEHSPLDRSDPGQQLETREVKHQSMKKILRHMALITFRVILTPVLKLISVSAPGGMLVLDDRSRNSDHDGSSSSTSVEVVDDQLYLSNSKALASCRNEPPVTVSTATQTDNEPPVTATQTDNEPPVTVSTATQTGSEPPMAEFRSYDWIVPILERRGPLELLSRVRGFILNISDIEDSEPLGDLRSSEDHTISLPSLDSYGSDGTGTETGTISPSVETRPSAFFVHDNPTFRSDLHGEDTPQELQSPVSRQDPSEQPGTPPDPSTSIDARPYFSWTPPDPSTSIDARPYFSWTGVQDLLGHAPRLEPARDPLDHAETPRLEPAREPLGHTIRYRTPDDAVQPDLDRVSIDKRIR